MQHSGSCEWICLWHYLVVLPTDPASCSPSFFMLRSDDSQLVFWLLLSGIVCKVTWRPSARLVVVMHWTALVMAWVCESPDRANLLTSRYCCLWYLLINFKSTTFFSSDRECHTLLTWGDELWCIIKQKINQFVPMFSVTITLLIWFTKTKSNKASSVASGSIYLNAYS